MTSGRIRTAVFSVAGVVFLSKVFGFLREMVIADKFGTSADYDLYLIATILPALFYGILNYAGFYLLVPYFSRRLAQRQGGDSDENWRSIWPVINVNVVASLTVTIIIVLAAPLVMKIWTGGFSDAMFARVVFFSRITAVAIVLGTTEAFIRAFLNVKKIFVYPAAGYIVFNLFSITSIILLYQRLSVGAVAFGWIGGLFLQNLYLLARLRGFEPFKGFRQTLYNSDVRTLLSTAGFLFAVELVNRSYFMIDRYFAVDFGEGVVSALNYSQVLVQLPDAIIGFAIGSVLFPMFSESFEAGGSRFGVLYRKTVSLAVLLAVPLAVVFYVNAEEIIYLVFFRGVFDAESVAITSAVLRPHALSIVALFVVSTSIRACYAGNWARQVLTFTIMLFVIKWVATALLSRWFGYSGITAATSLALIAFALSMLIFLIFRARLDGKWQFVLVLVRLIVAGLVAAIVAAYAGGWLPDYLQTVARVNVFFKLAVSSVIVLLSYLLLVYGSGLGYLVRDSVSMKRGEASISE